MYVCRAMLDAAHYLLRPLILRRVKSEVESLLPPKLETLIHCPMSDMQVGMYVCVYVASLSIFVVGLVCMYVCMYVCETLVNFCMHSKADTLHVCMYICMYMKHQSIFVCI